MVAAGADAGIAATFNTPIGGAMFAIELMTPEVSVRTFLPVAISTGTATFLGRFFLGQQPAFAVPPLPLLSVDASAATLCLYALLGAICGLAAAAFIHSLHLAEDTFDRIRERYTQHALGMLLVGILIYALMANLGHYYVEGVGYATVQAILLGEISGGASALAARLQNAGDLGEPRLRLLGRHLLTLALYGSHARRSVRRHRVGGPSAARHQHSVFRHGGDVSHGGRRP